MPRPHSRIASPSHTAPAQHSDPDRAGRVLCWALYRPGASLEELQGMRCRWDVLYVRVGSKFDRMGRICIHCGDVRER